MDTDQKTESIRQLIEHIDNGSVVLPEFQRDFVWEESKTYDLFDSLIRDIFVGSLIFGVPSFDITVRGIDTRPRKGQGSRSKLKLEHFTKIELERKVQTGAFRLLLDGQQRTTSLYRALHGIDDVWVLFKAAEELPPDVNRIPPKQRTLEDVLHSVAGKESEERLSVSVSYVFKVMRGEFSRDKDKAKILAESKHWLHQHDSADVEASTSFEEFLSYTEKIADLFKAEKLLSYYLLNTNEEKFALFFERSNTKGIQLNFIDILAAKLYKGFNLREKIDEFREAFPSYDLNRESIVRTIAFIESDGKDIGRNYILTNLTHVHFNDQWDRLCELYRKVLDYLYWNHLLISQSWMPFENMVIPMMVFLRELPKAEFSQMDQTQKRLLNNWYWSAIFSERYSVASDSRLIADAKALKSIANKDYVVGREFFRRFGSQISSAQDVLTLFKKGSAIYKGILNLVNFGSGGLPDWTNDALLQFNSKLEDHHIFPKEYLRKKLKIEGAELIDCVANRTLIPRMLNGKLADKAPSVYLKDLRSKNPKLQECLEKHLIVSDLIDGELDQRYNEFLEQRAEQIWQLLNRCVFEETALLEHQIAQASLR